MASTELNRNKKINELIELSRSSVVKSGVTDDPITFEFNQTLKYGNEFYKEKSRFPKTIIFIGETP